MILAACFLGAALLAMVVLLYKLQRLVHEERRSWQLERANLLQRIQAPSVAVVDHSLEGQPPDPEAVSLDDDADYWQHKADLLLQQERERLSA